jgi:hypothetical protein
MAAKDNPSKELRNLIYSFLLPTPSSIRIAPRKVLKRPQTWFNGDAALMHVCRQTRKEFSSMYFDHTEIWIKSLHIDLFIDVFRGPIVGDVKNDVEVLLWSKKMDVTPESWEATHPGGHGKQWAWYAKVMGWEF